MAGNLSKSGKLFRTKTLEELSDDEVLSPAPYDYDEQLRSPPLARAFQSTLCEECEDCEEKGNRFTDRQAQHLVDLWVKHHAECETSNSSVTWEKILHEVNKVGPEKTKKQIKRKITNLKLLYKKAKQNNDRPGRSAKSSKFYTEIDSVLERRDVITMPAVVSAGLDDKEECSESDSDQETEHNSASSVELAAVSGSASSSKPEAKRKGLKRKSKSDDFLDFQKSSFEKLMDRMERSERENRELLKQMDENSNRTILALAELLK